MILDPSSSRPASDILLFPQVRRILPYAFFYGLAIFVVLVALLDSAYVGQTHTISANDH